MDLDLYPRLVMWNASGLKVVWVLFEVVAPLEVAKTVPPSDLVLVCWGYSEVEYFHSESLVAVVVRVKFVSMVDMYSCARCR